MIKLDGSTLEGGGQLLRTAVALATVTQKSCYVFNIRKARSKPGLMPQHLLGIQALAQLCNGRLKGDYLGSEEIEFYPGGIKAKDLHIKIDTAGSITLCLQSLLPGALFAQNPIKIIFEGGGTDVPFSPTIDYFRYVFLKILERMGQKVEINVLKRGYYPPGGARVEVKVFPFKLKPLNLTERGQFKKILIFSVVSEFLKKKKVAERQIKGANEILSKLKLPIEAKIEYAKTDSAGSSICIISEFEQAILGSDVLGKLGKPAEQVGKECALQLLEEEKTKACLDRFLSDQILPYVALAGGKSEFIISKFTSHAKTNIWVIEKFIDGKFEINPHTRFGVGVKGNLISWKPA